MVPLSVPSRRLRLLIALACVWAAVGQSGGPDSCVGKCGKWSDNCWCNSGCESHGDCCTDYQAVCKEPPSESCPKCGSYTCDEWIQWDPKKYTCENLKQQWGCDCSGCKSCSSPGPSPSKNAATLVLLDKERYPQARCLDGSMAGYYLRKGSETKLLVYFEGGSWCYDEQCENPSQQGTLKDCSERSQGRLGSSKGWPHQQDSYFTGMLSADAEVNPVFHNWTLVYLPYCDGTSWSGDAVVDGLYFKGRAIRDAVIAELQSSLDVQHASQVVLSGGSAGASAVYYHADTIARALQLQSGEVLALPDAGFFLDLKDKDGIDCWPAQMRSVFEISNSYGSLHQGCRERFPKERWRCLFPEYYADLMTTRTFAVNSLYDDSEIDCTLRLDCCPGGCKNKPRCTGEELTLFEELRAQHIKAWAPLFRKPGNDIWAPACVTHTLTWGKWTDESWEVPARSGHTMAAAVQRWLANGSSGQQFAYQDKVEWPHNGPCSYSSHDSTHSRQPRTQRDMNITLLDYVNASKEVVFV